MKKFQKRNFLLKYYKLDLVSPYLYQVDDNGLVKNCIRVADSIIKYEDDIGKMLENVFTAGYDLEEISEEEFFIYVL